MGSDEAVAAAMAACAILLIASRRRRSARCGIDAAVDRRDVYTVKHTLARAPMALQLWVADMELACPAHIVDALVRRAEHPTYGYTIQPTAIWQRAARWLVELCAPPAAVAALESVASFHDGRCCSFAAVNLVNV